MSSENTSAIRNIQNTQLFLDIMMPNNFIASLPGSHGLLHCLRNDRLPYSSSGDDRLATFKCLFLEVPGWPGTCRLEKSKSKVARNQTASSRIGFAFLQAVFFRAWRDSTSIDQYRALLCPRTWSIRWTSSIVTINHTSNSGSKLDDNAAGASLTSVSPTPAYSQCENVPFIAGLQPHRSVLSLSGSVVYTQHTFPEWQASSWWPIESQKFNILKNKFDLPCIVLLQLWHPVTWTSFARIEMAFLAPWSRTNFWHAWSQRV